MHGEHQYGFEPELGAVQGWRIPVLELLLVAYGALPCIWMWVFGTGSTSDVVSAFLDMFVGAIALIISLLLLAVPVDRMLVDAGVVIFGLVLFAFSVRYTGSEIPVIIMTLAWVGLACMFSGMSSAVRRVGARIWPLD